jgi:hypothetical protein
MRSTSEAAARRVSIEVRDTAAVTAGEPIQVALHSAQLRFAHPQLCPIQQQLRSKHGNEIYLCQDFDVESVASRRAAVIAM